jgi:hypothetical protein
MPGADANIYGRLAENCPTPIHDLWNYSLTETSSPWQKAFGDPRVDAAAGQLVLSSDDIARRVSLPGAYFLSFDLDLEGNCTFYVGAPGSFVWHPSITRLGDQVILSGAFYTTRTLSPVGDFTNLLLPTSRVHLVFFAKTAAQEVALQVSTGTETHGSGFVAVGRDLREIVMVSNNNTGGDGPARLGTVDGCGALDDAEVEAAYAAARP